MSIIDITQEIKNADFGGLRGRDSEFNKIKCGLYLMVFKNTKDIEIRDKNKNLQTGMIGKVVAPPRVSVTKFGKFEGGLLNRMLGYYKHFHYGGVPSNLIFQDVLEKLFCLDLSELHRKSPAFNPARLYESYWNQSIHHWLTQEGFLLESQNMRSEYRLVGDGVISSSPQAVHISIALDAISKAINSSFPIFCQYDLR